MTGIMRSTLIVALAMCVQAALAHDPKEHEKERRAAARGPDCAALHGTDLSKVDLKDPVMKALHDKCSGPANHAAGDGGADQHADTPAPTAGTIHTDAVGALPQRAEH